MDRDIESLVDAYEEEEMSTKSKAGNQRFGYLEDGPLEGRTINYAALPNVVVVAEKETHLYHDYERRPRTNRYHHSENCHCKEK